MSESCKTCRFWEIHPAGDMGSCRRYPPVLSEEMHRNLTAVSRDKDPVADLLESTYAWVSPITEEDQWCGEWQDARPPSAFVHDPVDTLGLCKRIVRSLTRGMYGQPKILTVGDLIGQSADELLGRWNFSIQSLQEVREKLAAVGLKLRDERGRNGPAIPP